jgi:hypothetical protein
VEQDTFADTLEAQRARGLRRNGGRHWRRTWVLTGVLVVVFGVFVWFAGRAQVRKEQARRPRARSLQDDAGAVGGSAARAGTVGDALMRIPGAASRVRRAASRRCSCPPWRYGRA